MKRRRIVGPPRGPSLRPLAGLSGQRPPLPRGSGKEGNVRAAPRADQIVVYPTESFYALGADATDAKAIRQLFRIKHREKGKPIALIAGSMQQVQKFFSMSPGEKRLAKKHWPGSLTILLRPKHLFVKRLNRVAAQALGAKKIGVRIPAHPQARALALSIGAPITATSANISGQPPTKSAAKVKRDFPGILVMPGRCGRQRKPSTVVQIQNQKILMLRQGSVKL